MSAYIFHAPLDSELSVRPCVAPALVLQQDDHCVDVALSSCPCATCTRIDELINALDRDSPTEVYIIKNRLDQPFIRIQTSDGAIHAYSYEEFVYGILEYRGYVCREVSPEWARFVKQ